MSHPLAEVNEQRKQRRTSFYEQHRGILQELVEAGHSYRDMVRALNAKGFTNLSGNPWNLNSLSRCMKALGLRTQYMPEE